MSTMTTDGSTRVLVVDDEENITFLLGSALRHFGFDVTTAATGRQGAPPGMPPRTGSGA